MGIADVRFAPITFLVDFRTACRYAVLPVGKFGKTYSNIRIPGFKGLAKTNHKVNHCAIKSQSHSLLIYFNVFVLTGQLQTLPKN